MPKEIRMTNDESSVPAQQVANGRVSSVWKRRWMIAAEVALVLVIVALLIFTWLPAFIGARPGATPGR